MSGVQQQKKKQIDLSQDAISKRKANCEYAKVGTSGILKLTGAVQKWRSEPGLIYEPYNMVVGEEADLRKFYQERGFSKKWADYYIQNAYTKTNTAEGQFNEQAFRDAVQHCKGVRSQASSEEIVSDLGLNVVNPQDQVRMLAEMFRTYKKNIQNERRATSPPKSKQTSPSKRRSPQEKFETLEEGKFLRGLTDKSGNFKITEGKLSEGYKHVPGIRLAAKDAADFYKLLDKIGSDYIKNNLSTTFEDLMSRFRGVSTASSSAIVQQQPTQQTMQQPTRSIPSVSMPPTQPQQPQEEEMEVPTITSPEDFAQ